MYSCSSCNRLFENFELKEVHQLACQSDSDGEGDYNYQLLEGDIQYEAIQQEDEDQLHPGEEQALKDTYLTESKKQEDTFVETLTQGFVNTEGEVRNLLNESKDLSGVMQEDFECSICLLMLHKPVFCNSCDKLFCKVCIDKWILENDVCPCCNLRNFKTRDITLYGKKFLNRCKLKCRCG